MGNGSEKIAQKMAYLDKQINQAITKLESQFDELSTAVYSDKEPSGTFTPANESDFKTRFTKEEYQAKKDAFDRQVAYIQECVSELDKCTNELPPVEHYDEEFVDDFVSKVAKLNTNPEAIHSRQPMRFFSFAAVSQPKAGGGDQQISENYKISDFDCKTDGGTLVAKVPSEYYKYTKLLAQGMEVFAKKLGHSGKFQINSGYRSKSYDKKVGGSGNGLHCYAAAADIQIPRGTSKMSAFNTAAQCGFSGVIIYPGTGHIHVDVRKQVDAKQSSFGTTYYSTNGAKSGTSAPSGAVDTVEGVDPGGMSGGGGSSGGSGGSPGDYYGPTEPIKLVERTPDPEISKVIIPNGMANWNTMASALGVTVATLKKLNPAVVNLFPGTTLYIPTSAVSQARQLSTKAKSSVYAYSRYASFAVASFAETHATNYMLAANASHNNVSRASNQENTPFQSFRNNKEYIKVLDMKELEGKKEAFISIEYNGKVRKIETLISPVSMSETHSNSINVHQTQGGWFISRHGENPTQVSISGYMLDTKLAPEKHAFMLEFENYMTDRVNKATGEYENNAIIKLTVEGVEYQGHITSVTFNKDASRPLLYSFSMSFTCLYYKNLRNVSEALGILNSRSTDQNGRSIYVGTNLMNAMGRN